MVANWKLAGKQMLEKRLWVIVTGVAAIGFACAAYGAEARPAVAGTASTNPKDTTTLVAQAGGVANAASNAQADLDALIKAATAEGEVAFYSGATENIAKRIGEAFSAKYGIKFKFIRVASIPLMQRFATEAEAGTFAVDFYFNAGGTTTTFAADMIKKGWVEPISQAGLPALKSGQFPAKFVTGPTAMIQIAPWGIMYNTDTVKGADIPKDWPDILNLKFKGQVLFADPRSADAYLDMWALAQDKYGESFFARLRDMNPRRYANNVPAAAGLAAGEGMVQLPAVGQTVQLMRDKGAPVAIVTPDHTTGVEMHLTLTNRSKAPHPNAGRLFANYLLTPEGNKVFNADPGSVSVFDTTNLPKQYEPTKPGTAARKDQLMKLLGFQ